MKYCSVLPPQTMLLLLPLLLPPSLCSPLPSPHNEWDTIALNSMKYSQFRPELLSSDTRAEWINHYTLAFFIPSFPPIPGADFTTSLITQNRETNALYRKSPSLYGLVTAQEHDFMSGPQAAESADIHREEARILGEESHRGEVSSPLQEFLLSSVFAFPRSQRDNALLYHKVGSYLLSKLGRLGLFVSMHPFKFSFSGMKEKHAVSGVNVVGILPGLKWGTPEDKVIVVGAHWDTVSGSPGVADNGSGMVALLEIARLLIERPSVTRYSVILAAFDKEEEGCEGSRAFVRDFVIPVVIEKHGAQVQGMYNLDTILTLTPGPDTQDVPEVMERTDPGLAKEIREGGSRGDFVLTVSRATRKDSHLADVFAKHMVGYKVKHLTISALGQKMPPLSVMQEYIDLWRSDHVRFWYHTNVITNKTLTEAGVETQYSFPALLVTDGGYTRGHMRRCYHAPCDTADLTARGPHSSPFLAAVTEAILGSVLQLAKEEDVDEEETEEELFEEVGEGGGEQQESARAEVSQSEVLTVTGAHLGTGTNHKESPVGATSTVLSNRDIQTTNHSQEHKLSTNQSQEHKSSTNSDQVKLTLSLTTGGKIRGVKLGGELPGMEEETLEESTDITEEVNTNKSLLEDGGVQGGGNHYGHVDTQINVGSLHLAVNMESLLETDRGLGNRPDYLLFNMKPVTKELENIQSIIDSYYIGGEQAGRTSPMIVKMKADL